MLRHSSLDDIEYNCSFPHKSIKKRQRRHRRHRHQQKRRKSIKFVDYGASHCAVCLDDSCALDTTLFPCGHAFHGECLIQWVRVQNGRKFNCPLCRRDIAHFVPTSSNQDINDQLVQIWNDQYLYKSTADREAEQHGRAHSESESVCCDKSSSLDTLRIETIDIGSTCTTTDTSDTDSSSTIWNFLWHSPSSTIASRTRVASRGSVAALATTSTSPLSMWAAEPNQELDVSRPPQFRPSQPIWKPFGRHCVPCPATEEDTSTPWHDEPVAATADEPSVSTLETTTVNLGAGAFAGLAAGTTTYVATANRLFVSSALRGSLLPVLSETVPSVAVFFTSYEHLKSRVFGVDQAEKSTLRTFSERFASASVASTLGFVAPAVAKTGGFATVQGLLPLRFAAFFGTFEMCKDVMDTQHQRLDLLQVASAAAAGGTVSHGLCYPLLECQGLSEAVTGKQVLARAVYRGWASSLSKFLPSCVACSCAFEYTKRFLTTRTD